MVITYKHYIDYKGCRKVKYAIYDSLYFNCIVEPIYEAHL